MVNDLPHPFIGLEYDLGTVVIKIQYNKGSVPIDAKSRTR